MERDCVERRLLLTSETEIGVRGVNVLPTKTKQPRMQTKSFKETKMLEGKGRKLNVMTRGVEEIKRRIESKINKANKTERCLSHKECLT